ncbi:MAG TPA: hypothetical protein VFW78_03005 [Bacteroidia bacterium]|nr:hypothetical protein [Bacteroidia bacterium]
MKVKEVINATDARIFREVPLLIYKNDPTWIRPLDKDIEEVFDPQKNKFFRHGEAIRWLLLDENGKAIGRVAAFINRKLANRSDQPTGGMGFFECPNDQNAATILFDTCKEWLTERGMEAMEGPVNFGERDRWWGLLIEGFTEPVYCMNYNPPYYRELFENYGFREYFKQYCFYLRAKDPIDKKFEEAYDRLTATGEYHAEHIQKKDLAKYATDFSVIYNKAWAKFGGGKEISPEQALGIFKKMKPVMEEGLVWFAYYKKTEPVGLWLNLPELNQYFKHLNGKFGILQKLKFLWIRRFTPKHKFYGIVFGVVPEHQGKGVDGLMIRSGQIHILNKGKYDEMELQWIGDFNPKMISIARSLGTKQYRTLITYHKLFDPTKPFKRMGVI